MQRPHSIEQLMPYVLGGQSVNVTIQLNISGIISGIIANREQMCAMRCVSEITFCSVGGRCFLDDVKL